MAINILHRYTRAVLYASATAQTIVDAVVAASARGADLRGADLGGADLRGADLSGANLGGAYLVGAMGINPLRLSPLASLRDQPGPIRAYKLVTAEGVGPFNGGLVFRVGETVEVPNANTDESEQCGPGINVATLPWCLREWRDGHRVLIVEHTAADIAAIPIATDGKYRLHRCAVVGEKSLEELGIAQEQRDRAAWEAERAAKTEATP